MKLVDEFCSVHVFFVFFFSSRRRHTRLQGDWSSDVCSSDLIDSYLLKHGMSISQLIFGPDPNGAKRGFGRIDVTCNERQIKVVDRCGGIPRKRAMDEIFCFGHDPDDQAGKLGAYGVGMKRALFKIGNKFAIVSGTEKRAFHVSLEVADVAD